MAVDGKRQIGPRHALAVVGHANKAAAPAIGENVDTACPGIERVFDQFLDDARRPFDHLARGDAVDEAFRKLADWHGCRSGLRA